MRLTRQLRVSSGLFHTGMTTSIIASVIMVPRQAAAAAYGATPLGGYRDVAQQGKFIEYLPGAEHDAGKGVFSGNDRQTGLLAQQDIQMAQERSAAGKDDPLVDQVGCQFGRRALEAVPDRVHDRGN